MSAGKKPSLQDLVELVVTQLEGAFALLFKSVHYPGEVAATRRGSPLLIGVKCDSQLATNHIPIVFNKGMSNTHSSIQVIFVIISL
jgi:glucosamine--fructose-6-phosphate aminotransferase (isomerizing)